MQLPTTRPLEDAAGLWSVQQFLLRQAEQRLGERDTTKTIYQPVFGDDGPITVNTPSLDGAFARLGRTSEASWPRAVLELGHETVHLLNPGVGHTNWLEEGVAVEFSLEAQVLFNLTVEYPSEGPYLDALKLVRAIPGSLFETVRIVREVCGGLRTLTIESLSSTLPGLAAPLLSKLVQPCVPR